MLQTKNITSKLVKKNGVVRVEIKSKNIPVYLVKNATHRMHQAIDNVKKTFKEIVERRKVENIEEELKEERMQEILQKGRELLRNKRKEEEELQKHVVKDIPTRKRRMMEVAEAFSKRLRA